LLSFLIYFNHVDPEFVYNLTPDHVESLLKKISEFEDSYGVIGKQFDEHKLLRKQSSVTVTPDNVEKLAGSLQSIADVSESLAKKRKI